MLDRSKVMRELSTVADKLFVDFSAEYELVKELWQKIASDPTFSYKLKSVDAPWLLPTWQGKLDDHVAISQDPFIYSVVSVDGSQIYPDRHQGTSCFLVNIGIVELHYGAAKPVGLATIPYVFAGSDSEHSQIEASADLVNCKRQELEFEIGLERALQLLQSQQDVPQLMLFDGSLIFWHLESKDQAIRDTFLGSYLALLQKFYEHDLLIAGYISLPKNKELVNLLRVSLCDFVVDECTAYKEVDHAVDTTIARSYLPEFSRSIIFESHSNICQFYLSHLKPHFFYLNVGYEIARVEIPAWIARDDAKVDKVARMILDQSIKGRGYPVAIAEAHEQAVVKGPDRDFFYHCIQKMSIEHKLRVAYSQKVLKKRGIGI